MTLLQLRTAVKAEARVKVGTNLDQIINEIISELLRDYGNRARYREVLALDVPLTLVDEQSQYALPNDFQHMQAVRYSNLGVRFWPLYEFQEGQLRISNVGYPKYYQLFEGGIQLFPSTEVRTTQTFYISYFRDPSSLFAADPDEFPIPRLESAVKKQAIARIVRYMQNLDETKLVAQDAERSFAAGQGGQ